ncbi:MAG: hypothetical protein JWO80_3146 [Bryobacterales bacterium]|nr:hypothetical protein [Bryobacterales bacterium]
MGPETDFDQIDRLIEHLRQSGIKVITSDPFLGLAGRLPRIDPQNPFEQFLSLPMNLAGEMLIGPDFSYMVRPLIVSAACLTSMS